MYRTFKLMFILQTPGKASPLVPLRKSGREAIAAATRSTEFPAEQPLVATHCASCAVSCRCPIENANRRQPTVYIPLMVNPPDARVTDAYATCEGCLGYLSFGDANSNFSYCLTYSPSTRNYY